MMKTILASAAALACLGATPATAVPIFLDSITSTGSGTFSFNYRAEFSTDEGIQTGSKLVIFDFLGYVDGSIFAPGIITTSIELFSNLADFGYDDDPLLPNLVFSYTGPLVDLSGQSFANFGALSTFGDFTIDGFSDITVKSNGSGILLAQQGGVGVPAVPEPASWAMLILGFGTVGMALRRHQTRISFA